MDNESLLFFLEALKRLKRANTKYGLAPHKPVLMLTFFEMVEKGMISDNRVEISADLVGMFLENWRLLVHTPHQADFTQPFYYLQNDRFKGVHLWFLVPKPGRNIHGHIKTINTLSEFLDFGYFEERLFSLLKDKESNYLLTRGLLESYFPNAIDIFLSKKNLRTDYLEEWRDFILKDSSAPTKRIKLGKEEEVFVRQSFFKKFVPQVYNDTCCITGMRLISLHGYSMVDACHIIPFSVGQNDHITNGIALCPNLHRAFDRGLISISDDYSVLVSKHLTENRAHPYSMETLNSRKILLPKNPSHFPDRENLKWHRVNIFKA